MRKGLNKKGISLIVLVITIIVMIILATAIILSLNSSGIIGKANKAKADSDAANIREAAGVILADYQLAVATGENVGGKNATQYVRDELKAQGIPYENVAVDEDNNVVIGSGAYAIVNNVKIGEYIGYTPTAAEYTPEPNGRVILQNSATTFTTEENLKWKYLGIDKDGHMLLVSDAATSQKLGLGNNPNGYSGIYSGMKAYHEGSDLINDICNKVYSSDMGNARSMDALDVNKVLGYTENKIRYKGPENDEPKYKTYGVTIGELEEKHNTEVTHKLTDDDTSYKSIRPCYYDYDCTGYQTTNPSGYNIVFNGITSEIGTNYWLATQFTYANLYDSKINYGIARVQLNKMTITTIYDTLLEYGFFTELKLRPVIEINNDVKMTGEKNTDGAWILTK